MNFSPQSIYAWYRQAIRNPRYRWLVILGTLAYIVSPFDILPDVIPFVGQIDDVMIVTILMAEVFQMAMERIKAPGSEGATAANPFTEPAPSSTAEAAVHGKSVIDVDATSVG